MYIQVVFDLLSWYQLGTERSKARRNNIGIVLRTIFMLLMSLPMSIVIHTIILVSFRYNNLLCMFDI